MSAGERLVHGVDCIGAIDWVSTRRRPARVGTCSAHRLEGIPPTIFSEMSALAARTGAVNLGQGFPDVDGPPSGDRAGGAGAAGRSEPVRARPRRPRAAGRRSRGTRPRHYGLDLDPDREVVVTTGCTEGIAAALLGLVDEGDEVVVLEPYYDSYTAMIQMAGGVRRPVTLRAPDFRLDPDELRAAVTPAHPVRAAELPAQPDRHRAQPGGAAGGRGRRDRARPDRGHRRGLRAPGLRRPRARPARDAAGDVRADPHAVQRRQVVLVHRLEGRAGPPDPPSWWARCWRPSSG